MKYEESLGTPEPTPTNHLSPVSLVSLVPSVSKKDTQDTQETEDTGDKGLGTPDMKKGVDTQDTGNTSNKYISDWDFFDYFTWKGKNEMVLSLLYKHTSLTYLELEEKLGIKYIKTYALRLSKAKLIENLKKEKEKLERENEQLQDKLKTLKNAFEIKKED